MVRAADSISANLSEAFGSCGLIEAEAADTLDAEIRALSYRINAYIKHLKYH